MSDKDWLTEADEIIENAGPPQCYGGVGRNEFHYGCPCCHRRCLIGYAYYLDDLLDQLGPLKDSFRCPHCGERFEIKISLPKKWEGLEL